MGPDKLFDQTTHLLEAVLDRRATRNNLMSRNLANIDTPGYEGTGLEFEKQLRAALEGTVQPASLTRTDPRHMPQEPPKPFSQAAPVYKNTGPVHLDIEMSKLAENNIMFSAMVQLLSRKFNLLKTTLASE